MIEITRVSSRGAFTGASTVNGVTFREQHWKDDKGDRIVEFAIEDKNMVKLQELIARVMRHCRPEYVVVRGYGPELATIPFIYQTHKGTTLTFIEVRSSVHSRQAHYHLQDDLLNAINKAGLTKLSLDLLEEEPKTFYYHPVARNLKHLAVCVGNWSVFDDAALLEANWGSLHIAACCKTAVTVQGIAKLLQKLIATQRHFKVMRFCVANAIRLKEVLVCLPDSIRIQFRRFLPSTGGESMRLGGDDNSYSVRVSITNRDWVCIIGQDW